LAKSIADPEGQDQALEVQAIIAMDEIHRFQMNQIEP